MDEGIIRCICGYDHDDGFTIQCEKCYVWQHAVCVSIRKDKVPDEYFCERCNPRELDAETAKEVQRRRQPKQRRRSKTAANAKDDARGSPGKPGRRPTNTKDRMHAISSGGRDLSEDSASNAGGYLDSEDDEDFFEIAEDYIPVAKNVIHNHAIHDVLQSIRQDYFHQLSAASSTDAFSNGESASRSIDDLPPLKQSHSTDSSSMDPSLTSKLTGNPSSAAKHPDSSLLKELRLVSDSNELAAPSNFRLAVRPASGRSSVKTGVFSDSEVDPDQFLVEFKGEIIRKRDYLAQLGQNARLMGPPERFVLFHSALDLAIDARRYGNEARFIRYSCRPNSYLKSVVASNDDENFVHLCMYSYERLRPGEELTIRFEGDFEDHGKFAIDCACSDYYTCLYNLNAKKKPAAREVAEREAMEMDPPAAVEGNENHGGRQDTGKSADQSNGGGSPIFSRPVRAESRVVARQHDATMEDPMTESDDQQDFSGDEKIPDTPTMERKLTASSEAPLSREERKIRDELARFARMEKDRKQRRKKGKEAGETNSRDSGAYDSSTSASESTSRRNQDESESGLTSRMTSAPPSPPARPTFMKKLWLQRFSGDKSAASDAPVKPTASVSSLSEAHSSYDVLFKQPPPPPVAVVQPVSVVVESPTEAPIEPSIPDAVEVTDPPMKEEPMEIVEIKESVILPIEKSVSSKRPAPADEKDETASSATAEVATTRISLKDYKKKRKILQQQDSSVSLGNDEELSVSTSLVVSPTTPTKTGIKSAILPESAAIDTDFFPIKSAPQAPVLPPNQPSARKENLDSSRSPNVDEVLPPSTTSTLHPPSSMSKDRMDDYRPSQSRTAEPYVSDYRRESSSYYPPPHGHHPREHDSREYDSHHHYDSRRSYPGPPDRDAMPPLDRGGPPPRDPYGAPNRYGSRGDEYPPRRPSYPARGRPPPPPHGYSSRESKRE